MVNISQAASFLAGVKTSQFLGIIVVLNATLFNILLREAEVVAILIKYLN